MSDEKLPGKFKLAETEYLELWKWFTDDAAKIKDKMWTIATFFYTALGAMLGYVGKLLFSNNTSETNDPNLIWIVAIVGCLLSGYGIFMLREYGKHIRLSWNRANYIRFRIVELSDIWCHNNPKVEDDEEDLKTKIDNSLPPVSQWLIGLLALFFIVFLVILLSALNFIKLIG